jgi:acyl-CoA thioesterase FadM
MAPEAATWHTPVRVYECDELGHVNNAWYLAYVQQATAEAWADQVPAFWDLRRLAIDYLSPAVGGDELEVAVFPAGREDGLPACGYLLRTAGGRAVARARAVWAWLDPQTRRPWTQAVTWPEEAPPEGVLPRSLRLGPDRLGAPGFMWRHRARHYELNSVGHVSPVEILRWLEEAKYVACTGVGWSPGRLLHEGCVIVQIRHDSQFYVPLAFGDEVEVRSRIYDVGRVRGTWRHELYRGDELVALDYSSGAFLDLAGRPSPPPQEMLAALLHDR